MNDEITKDTKDWFFNIKKDLLSLMLKCEIEGKKKHSEAFQIISNQLLIIVLEIDQLNGERKFRTSLKKAESSLMLLNSQFKQFTRK